MKGVQRVKYVTAMGRWCSYPAGSASPLSHDITVGSVLSS